MLKWFIHRKLRAFEREHDYVLRRSVVDGWPDWFAPAA